MGLAWLNIFWGLQLREYGWFVIACALVAMVGMAAVWIGWSLGWIKWGSRVRNVLKKQHAVPSAEEERGREELLRDGGNEFALDDLEDEEEDEDNEIMKAKDNKL